MTGQGADVATALSLKTNKAFERINVVQLQAMHDQPGVRFTCYMEMRLSVERCVLLDSRQRGNDGLSVQYDRCEQLIIHTDFMLVS